MRYTITVPTKDRLGEMIRPELRKKVLEDTIRDVINLTGGCTTFEGKGHWTNKSGRLISEKVTKVETYCDREHFRIELMTIASKLKETLNQEAVFITTGGKGEIV